MDLTYSLVFLSLSPLRVLGVLSHPAGLSWLWTLTPGHAMGSWVIGQGCGKVVEVTVHHGPWGVCSASHWGLTSGRNSLVGYWPPHRPPDEITHLYTHTHNSLYDCNDTVLYTHNDGVLVCLWGVLTCPGVLSVGSGPWWNSLCNFPEWRSRTNCLSFPGILRTHINIIIRPTNDITEVWLMTEGHKVISHQSWSHIKAVSAC